MSHLIDSETIGPIFVLILVGVVLFLALILVPPIFGALANIADFARQVGQPVQEAADTAEKVSSRWQEAITELLGLGEIKESWFECNGECGETARIIEVCNAVKKEMIWSNEIKISVTTKNRGESGDFNIRLRPPTGSTKKLLPCQGIALCQELRWRRMVTGEEWTESYNTAGGADSLKYWKDGYAIQLRKETTDNRVDAVGITPDMIPAPGAREICTTFER